jgi:alkanesulfonate monooxygenase SsuD/methylene tetrahydromethanopterin reductase-like flavin-dependent oxidoreductase (luciferase family)
VQIRDAWDAAGRTEEPHLSSSIWYALGDDAEERLRDYAYTYMKIMGDDVGKWAASAVTCFTPEALRAAVDHAHEAGADEFFLVPTTSDPDELARTRDALGV